MKFLLAATLLLAGCQSARYPPLAQASRLDFVAAQGYDITRVRPVPQHWEERPAAPARPHP